MALLAVSPGQNVNKGLAEDWQSPLPYQIDLLKSAARLKAHAADMNQRREMQRQKLAQDWWDDFRPNMEGLTSEQTDVVSNMYNQYLGNYAAWINAGRVPENRTGVLRDRDTIVRNIDRYKSYNNEMGQVKTFLESDEGKFMNVDKMYPLIYEHIQLDPDGYVRTDIRSGEVWKFINEHPEAMKVWDGDALWKRFAKNYKEQKKNWIYGTVVGAGEYESPYTVTESYVGPDVWNETERRRGNWVLKDEVVATIAEDEYLDRKIRSMQAQGDTRSYGQIAQDFARRHSTGQTTIDKLDEQTVKTSGSGDPQLQQAKRDWLNDTFSSIVKGDQRKLELMLEQISSVYNGGIRFEFIPEGITAEFPTNDINKSTGDPVMQSIAGPAYVPIITDKLQQTVDLPARMVAAQYNYMSAQKMSSKNLAMGQNFIPDYAVVLPNNNDSVIQRQNKSELATTRFGRLYNLGTPQKNQYSNIDLNEWSKSLNRDVNLFQEDGTFDWEE
jgi:hypothetical protein